MTNTTSLHAGFGPSALADTADLRDETGRLHIDRIADVFGLMRAALARAVGSTPQAVANSAEGPTLGSASA